jgi:DNA-binding NtrC family response regulator
MSDAKRFLVVDHHSGIGQLVSAILQIRAKTDAIILARDAGEALTRLHTEYYDYLIIDRSVPGTDKRSLFHEIRQLDPSIQILLITTNSDIALKKEITGLWGIGILHMPFEVDDLLRALSD